MTINYLDEFKRDSLSSCYISNLLHRRQWLVMDPKSQQTLYISKQFWYDYVGLQESFPEGMLKKWVYGQYNTYPDVLLSMIVNMPYSGAFWVSPE